MKTGIVILNYNDKKTVITLTESIMAYESIEDIVIVDNCSKDDSYEYLKKKYENNDKVTVLLSPKNGGYSYGNNLGARYLIGEKKSDMVIIANPDVLFEQSLVQSLRKEFEGNPEYGVLTGVMVRPDGSVDPMPYRKYFSYLHDLGDMFLTVRRLVYEKRRNDIDYSRRIMEVQVIQGSFFAISAKAFKAIDGLDDKVFLYYEELILGKRLEQAGYKTGILTYEKFLHNHSVSIKKSVNRINMWKIMLESKYYYQREYNRTGTIRMVVLKFFGNLSIVEKNLIEVLRKL